MSKWIKIDKSMWGFSAAIVLFDKVSFYAGRSESWGIGIKLNFYDRALTFEILNLYIGIEIYRKEWPDYDWSPDD